MENANILIVEDEAVVAKDLEGVLGALGYGISGSADNGKAALTLAKRAQPDLVLMDIRLKGNLDGIGVAEELNKDAHIPVVYLTAYADDRTVTRARQSGPYGFLLKPFNEKTLQITINNALFKHQHDRTTALDLEDCKAARKNSAIVAKNVENNLLGALNAEIEQRKWLEKELEEALRRTSATERQDRPDLINRLSNDIRIPLENIIGFSQVLLYNEEEHLSSAQRGHTEQILESGLALQVLIKQLHTLSRIDTRQLKLNMLDNVSIAEIVSEVISQAIPSASSRSISLHNNTDFCRNTRVATDPVRLMQVLANLLSVAVASGHEGTAISVSCQYTRPGTLHLNITDSGPDIPEKYREQIFAPIIQTDDLSYSAKQIGIGLIIAKELAILMGGRVGVDCTPGEGNTFWVELKPAGLS